MVDPCAHCGIRNRYDPNQCPGICNYGSARKTLEEHEKNVKEWRTVEFPVNIADHVCIIREEGVIPCTIRTIRSKALGGWTFRLFPEIQTWLCNAGTYYEVNLAQYGKTWFKDEVEARAAHAAKYGRKH